MPKLPGIFEMLAALVAVPSVSASAPELDQSNRGVVDLLAGWLATLGFAVEIIPIAGQTTKANLIATRGEGDGGLVLSGHTDTVPYDHHRWQQDPFTLTERDGRWYGLGATDMKGFFPVVLEAIRRLGDTQFKYPLTVLATADEETSMDGARQLLEQGRPRARFAVIGEPTDLKPARLHKGMMMESLVLTGRSGHSSNPALGANALEAMTDAIGELRALRAELQGRYRNAAFEVTVPTLNLGCIHGGDAPNRICGECELHFDLRPLPGMDIEALRAAISTRLQPLAERHGVNVQLRSLFAGVPPFEQAADSMLVHAVEELSGHRANAVGFATEAPFLQQLGMETVVFGPGSIDHAHQPNEFIDSAQIEPAIAAISGLIRRFCL